MFWDPTFIVLIPAIILAAYAQFLVSSRFSQYSKVRSTFGYTGSQLARRLLDNAGLYDIHIERVRGNLTDHYDSRKRVVRLSQATHDSSSIAALGVVAHEIGHAIQDKEKYAPLVVRNAVVPVAQLGSSLSWILFVIGLLIVSPLLIRVGILVFSAFVFFTLVTLPVEFNASSRAKKLLASMGMPSTELKAVGSVLGAAAMTYVASTATAILQLLRMLLIAGAYGSRD
ncbi:MAG TPA: zinc metallopeptidase [Mesotoga infera]|jgi:Zn-dependent membrane protease YugP|uniref:Putative membrane protease YugP n=1 Tax=Mesotoga infera TaxID=1236046 RepID=A0A7Z7LEF3_9BACT|nr:zinc metallopeptidase [Mesotoga infera]MBP8659483.1 zinc metallopeptidase [Mesotoga sp.]NLI07003.1 zinc metallopeptidase [Thermotogaceae bacterium]SSC11843.1 putative membrane protease YugP [Mesotoga infera]HNS67209.1 zinc metallopeptidase [Mesotoga infera]HOI34018.1 zinc metallopeptidase [Mesotoga infera]